MSTSPVKRRWVLYVSGFDPAGPAKYHQLYKEQSALAAPLLGAKIEVSKRSNRNADKLVQWQVRHTPDDNPAEAVETDYVFARWDDLVRQHWLPLRNVRQVWAFLQAFFATHWLFWHSGAMLALLRLGGMRTFALILPLIIATVGLALIIMNTAIGIWGGIYHVFFDQNTLVASIEYAQAAIISIVALVLWCLLSWQFEKRWHMLWLMRSYLFTRLQALGRLPALEQRLSLHAQHIRQAASSGLYDEILVVGHSSGCIMASLALARALPLIGSSPSQISLLTLGHCWPMLSSLPSAQSARNELAHLSKQPVKWVDVSAAADGCCYAFVDPTPENAPHRPQLVSARWHTLFPAATYQALKRDRFRFHFQYLFATPVIGSCDFFAITSGPLSLTERFANVPAVKLQK
jgi:hypothetical protein